MAFNFPDNQPVVINRTDDGCDCESLDYNQLVNEGDVTQFQLLIDRCVDIGTIIDNGSFIDNETDWTFLGAFTVVPNVTTGQNEACISSLNTGSIEQLTLIPNKYFRVELDVELTEGSIDVYLGTNLIQTISTSGHHVLYGFQLTTFGLKIDVPNPSIVCVTNIEAFIIPINYIIAFYEGTNYITEFNIEDLITPSDPTADEVTLIDGFLTVSVDWLDLLLTNDCYNLCIFDPCENTCGQTGVFDPSFEINETSTPSGHTRWVLTDPVGAGSTRINAGLLRFSVNTIGQFGTAVQGGFCAGKRYTINLSLALISDGVTVVTIGTVVFVNGVENTADGTDLTIKFTRTVGVIGNAIADYNSITVTMNTEDYTRENCSNTFKVSQAHECTKLINACNEENGLDFGFNGTGFSPIVRLDAKLKHPFYPSNREVNEDTGGTKSVQFYRRRKIQQLAIAPVPEYILDFISLWIGFDHFYIDDVEFFAETDELQPDWEVSSDDVAPVTLDVSVKTQDIVNENCSGENTGGCNLSGEFLLWAGDGEDPEYLLQEDEGRIIL